MIKNIDDASIKRLHLIFTSTSPVLYHQFYGEMKSKELVEKSDAEQAEYYLYRCSNGNIGIPAKWIRGCLKEAAYVTKWSTGQKGTAKEYVAGHIRVSPLMLDLGIKEYDEILIEFIPTPDGRGRPRCARPLIKEWKCKGTLVCSVKEDDDVLSLISYAGEHKGIGNNRRNGYGRFKVVLDEDYKPDDK